MVPAWETCLLQEWDNGKHACCKNGTMRQHAELNEAGSFSKTDLGSQTQMSPPGLLLSFQVQEAALGQKTGSKHPLALIAWYLYKH